MAKFKWKDTLETTKSEKAQELNKACESAIISGFSHIIDGVEYHFSFDIEAQLNFQGSAILLSNGTVEEIMWTVKKAGEYTRIPINQTLMNELMLVILQHKDSKISKYRDVLMPQVKNATALEQIQKIKW